MSRYVVERDFPHGLRVPVDVTGMQHVAKVVDTNAEHGVTCDPLLRQR